MARSPSASDAKIATALYCAVAAAGFAWWSWLGRGTTFLYDEWDFVLSYRENFWAALVTPHNGQFDAIPVMIYRTMFALFGTGRYWPYRLVGIGFLLALTTVIFAYLCRRLNPLLALVATAALMANGQAWQDMLWPFELTFTISLAAGVAALMFLDRGDATGEAWAAACLALSVASSGFGLVFLAGTGVEIAWSSLARAHTVGGHRLSRALWPWRLWVALPGLAIYLAWYVHDHVHDASLSRAHEIPRYIAESAGYGTGALFGLRGLLVGEVLALLLALIVATRLILGWRTGARLAMVVAAGSTYWVLMALARGNGVAPSTSRYLLPDSLFVLLALVETVTGPLPLGLAASAAQWWRSSGPGRAARATSRLQGPAPAKAARSTTTPTAALVLVASSIVTLAGVPSSSALVSASQVLRSNAALVRGGLRAVELAGVNLPPNLQPLPTEAPEIKVGPYLRAASALGSPADTNAQLLEAPETVRSIADSLLASALRMSVTVEGAPSLASSAVDPAMPCSPNGSARSEGGHLLFELGRPALFIAAPARSPVEVRLRLFASQFPAQPMLTVSAGDRDLLVPRGDLSNVRSPWWAQLTVLGQGQAVACPLAP